MDPLGGTFERRTFLTGTAGILAALRAPDVLGRTGRVGRDELRVCVCGLNGRGSELIDALLAIEGVSVVALCDVDEVVLERELERLRERGVRAGGFSDLRRVLRRPDVQAVVLATPDHWHALQAIWACEAGKDVYLEAPVSHNVLEGRQLVLAARKHGRLVQCGTQARSSSAIEAGFEWVRAGNLGAVRVVRCICFAPQPSIGRADGPLIVPETVDFDLWCGPRELNRLKRMRLHHDWRYTFDTGAGVLGSRGVHLLDLARAFLGGHAFPSSIATLGGRFGYVDDGSTPNTFLGWLAYEQAPLLFELRGLPRNAKAQEVDFEVGMETVDGVREGLVIECEGGALRVPSRRSAIAVGRDGGELRRWEGTGDHVANFVEAVRGRAPGDLRAGIEEGHVSSSLVHLLNISHRLGTRLSRKETKDKAPASARFQEALERLWMHLDANHVNTDRTPEILGADLRLDPRDGRILQGAAAAGLLEGSYRRPYVLPG